MKFKKILALLFVCLLAVVLVACDKDDPIQKDDPLTPTNITLKVKVAKVQINNDLKITYAITPATAQGDEVTIELNNNLATFAKEGNNSIVLHAGDKEGTVKVTVKTSNGITATKTIKIQLEAVESYPDLNGYTIKLAQAEHALGYYDVKLTKETEDKYNYYSAADREYKNQAWDEIEDNYNCTLAVVAYPSDAPWGPSRWQYILTQAQNDAAEYDLYVVPDGQIPGFVAGNALVDLTDWYAQYGKNIMTNMSITAGTYKQRLYSINENAMNVYNMLGYNIGLWEQINEKDPTIKEPAQMYLDGEWNYDTFKEYCIKVQTVLNTYFSSETEPYYCLSGYGSYYWLALVNAAGIKILDTTQLKVNIAGDTEAAAAKTLQDIYAQGAMDTAFQVDGGVATWNAGHSLFNSGDFWFVNASDRWSKTLWTDEEHTKYGYVPYPTSPTSDRVYIGTTAEACIVMPTGREWAYKGYGEECTTENIYRAYMDYITSAKKYYTTSEDYDYVGQLTATATSKFSSEASVKAYLKVMLGDQKEDGSYEGGIEEYGFFEPFVENSNPVVGNYSSAFAMAINNFIKGGDASAQWVDAVGIYQSDIEKSLVDAYG